MFIPLVAPPGAGEQNKGPAGQIRGSEERSCPETTGTQVFYGAVDVHTHAVYLHYPAVIQMYPLSVFMTLSFCAHLDILHPSVSFSVLLLSA